MVIDLREQVMNDVELDDVVEKVFANEAKLTIDGGGSPLDEGPGLGIELG